MNKVTIVVPTYNVEAYIAKCLDSLIAQTSKEFEVLVINDGSPANEQKIINRYVKEYPYIHSIQKVNGGYGSVLARAVESIETPYMLICDPDDYLYPNTVSDLLSLMEKTSADLVIGAKTLVYADNDEQVYDKSYNDSHALLINRHVYERGTDEYDQLFFVEPSPHAKLYKTAYLKNLQFPEKVSYTDNILYFMTIIQTEKVVYTSEPLAFYLINRVGNTRTDVKLSVINSWIAVFLSILQQAKKLSSVPGIFYYRMFEGYKHIFNNKIDNVQATDDEFRLKLVELYQIIQLLLPYKHNIRKYYYRFSEYQIIEQLKDRLLLNKFSSKWIYQRMTEKKLYRRGTQ